jgi:hypothetical protein
MELFAELPAFMGSSAIGFQQKSHARERMAESSSPPASGADPRSLRRHYPHQVQGVVRLASQALSLVTAGPLSHRSSPAEPA